MIVSPSSSALSFHERSEYGLAFLYMFLMTTFDNSYVMTSPSVIIEELGKILEWEIILLPFILFPFISETSKLGSRKSVPNSASIFLLFLAVRGPIFMLCFSVKMMSNKKQKKTLFFIEIRGDIIE